MRRMRGRGSKTSRVWDVESQNGPTQTVRVTRFGPDRWKKTAGGSQLEELEGEPPGNTQEHVWSEVARRNAKKAASGVTAKPRQEKRPPGASPRGEQSHRRVTASAENGGRRATGRKRGGEGRSCRASGSPGEESERFREG